ncbi:hypothetical protein NDU88_002505 [Pleurodeles waltl]|uniref:Uncharacterized protein n=1 Tax=Pleurodeles waltl TaxID=8319 RepID=A0AAV7T292_PLEWA|nr:hypothetical protein NDU88_002505 [Pleurodeles waltl]
MPGGRAACAVIWREKAGLRHGLFWCQADRGVAAHRGTACRHESGNHKRLRLLKLTALEEKASEAWGELGEPCRLEGP